MFRRRPVIIARRPLMRRRWLRRPGCFTFLLSTALLAAGLLAILF